MLKILILITLLQVKHFLADFPLQNAYMLKKGQRGGWIVPLLLHVTVHWFLTIVVLSFVLLAYATSATFVPGVMLFILGLATAEAAAHFIIDRIKASPNMLGQYSDTKTPAFWICLGADQLAHNLCYVAMVAVIHFWR